MASQQNMKCHKDHKDASALFERLTMTSPQSVEATGFPAGKRNSAASSSQGKPSTTSARQDSWTYNGGEMASVESFVGLSLHENVEASDPVTAVSGGVGITQHDNAPAVEAEYAVQAVGGSDDKDQCYDYHNTINSEEEKRHNSLPASVLALEDREGSPDSDYQNSLSSISESQKSTSESSYSQISSSVSSDLKDDTENETYESGKSDSLPWVPNLPVLDKIMPNIISSSDETTPALGKGGVMLSSGNSINLDVSDVQRTVNQVNACLQGFLCGTVSDLQDYLTKIVTNERDFGFYVSDKLRPSYENNVMCYRENQEFLKLETMHQLKNNCGVFKCRDLSTKHVFVWKKIMKTDQRLVGIEFLTQHYQPFLPKVYGVYKEKETISIFQEFVKGGTLLRTDWNLAQVRKFAEVLLSAFHYLHAHDLVHGDIKLTNLMVRDVSDPESLVLIDFESAKHPQYHFHKGGHTLTYIPPWHEEFMNKESYDQVLKVADLWAIACVIIFFLMPMERSSCQMYGVWSHVMRDIKGNCGLCKKEPVAGKYCNICRKNFMSYVKDNGKDILHQHLGDQMNKEIDDPNWKALRQVLEYLTDTNNIREKHISIALSILKGPLPMYQQPAIEGDYSTRPQK